MGGIRRQMASGNNGSIDIKNTINLYQEFENPDAMLGYDYKWRSVLVGMNNQRIRIRYPKGTDSKVKYLDNPTTNFLHLTALWICNLIPIGVYADALQENYPEHEEAAHIMREWEKVKSLEVKT